MLEDLQKTKVSTLLRVSASDHRSDSFMADARGPGASRRTSNAGTTFEEGRLIPLATGVSIHRSGSVSGADAISTHSGSATGISDQIPSFDIPLCTIRLCCWDRPMGQGPLI